MPLSAEEILQLAPDGALAKAANGLTVVAQWPQLQFDDEAVWGACKGSGSKPYQVQVDRSGPAFRCSCPSRKFPCKHGLALLLLFTQLPTKFERAPAPAWVSEWLASRRERAIRQEQRKSEDPAANPDPQEAAKREAARAARMSAGLEELSRWMSDRLRQGLAQFRPDPASWDELAKRMVDAQLPGVASRVRRVGADVGRTPDWPERVLAAMGQLQLLVDAFSRLGDLPSSVRADVRSAVGVTVDRDSVVAEGEQVSDEWLVLGQAFDGQERLWVRRVWLHGLQSGRDALLLDFAHGSRRFETVWVVGSTVALTLAFFPGAAPLRAVALGKPVSLPAAALPGSGSLDRALERLTTTAAANPWQFPVPMRIDDAVPARDDQGWCLHVAGHRLPMSMQEQDGWQLLSQVGGAAVRVAGEWDGQALRPLSAWDPALVWAEEVPSE